FGIALFSGTKRLLLSSCVQTAVTMSLIFRYSRFYAQYHSVRRPKGFQAHVRPACKGMCFRSSSRPTYGFAKEEGSFITRRCSSTEACRRPRNFLSPPSQFRP
ncbi:hypothetical protein EV421DRAFT_1831668, partial [Armillaria borealis]